MPKVNKVGHVVLNVRNTEVSAEFYRRALGMEIVSHNTERHSAFLSFGTQHHDIALFQASGGSKAPDSPEPLSGPERGKLGLNHIAFQIEGSMPELEQLRQRLVAEGVKVDRETDHGITKSVYFFDPDGNRLEIFSETMSPLGGLEYMRTRGGTSAPMGARQGAAL